MYYDSSAAEALAAVGVGLVVGIVFALIIALVFYLFGAIGLYKIAKNRGDRQAWLAFIPVACNYTLGGVADNINGYKGKKSSFRFILLILGIISAIGGTVALSSMISALMTVMTAAFGGADHQIMMALIGRFGGVMLVSLISLTLTILVYIVHYKIYTDYSPSNAVLFVVLEILFGIAPFFIFAIRNNTPQTLAQAYQPPMQQPPQPPQY